MRLRNQNETGDRFANGTARDAMGRFARITAALALAVLVAACGSRPNPALLLAEERVPGASEVELYAVTTRRESPDPGLRFGGERTLSARFARMVISIPKDRPTGEIVWPQGAKAEPKTAFAAQNFDVMTPEVFGQSLGASIRKHRRRHVLVFVHGYNTRFDEGAFRLAQIVHDSNADVVPVLFSWASWATLTAYPYDRESAALARDGLEQLLTKLAQWPAVGQVSVLAHSMGGWLTLEALRQMAIRNRSIDAKITDVMLAAPDVDVDVAQAHARALAGARRKPKLTLFVSNDDKALSASRLLWGSRDRLGSLDPTAEPYRTNLAKAGVDVFDLSGVSSSDQLNHGKFAQSPAVVQLIGRRLAAGQSFEGSGGTSDALETIAHGASRVVGGIITAPLKIGENAPPPSQAATD